MAVRSSAGFPGERITSLRCVTLADSSLMSDGRYRDQCRVIRVHDRLGMSASGQGRVTVFSTRKESFAQGSEVLFTGRLLETKEGDWLFFSQDSGGQVLRSPEGLYKLRRWCVDFTVEAFRPLRRGASGLLTALFLGIRDFLEEDHLFRQAGCSHILALSGMHVGIITGFLSLLIRPLLGKRLSILFLYIFIFAYLFLTGFGPSLNRSALMFLFLSAPSFFSRKPSSLQVLSLSFVVLAILSPVSVKSLSFQLSFLALGGILLIGRVVLPALSYLPPWLKYPLSASLGAQLASSPLVATVFGIIYPAGMLASLVITPLVTLFMAGGMIYLLLDGMGCALPAGILSRGLEYLSDLLFHVAGFFARIPGVSTENKGSMIVTLVSAILVLLFLGYARFRVRRYEKSLEGQL
ncbi:MAG: ComEC/Rec2 family competence protein [Spirochaetales bacterium]|nr:ComEC/Rec2 family competence protein [Spirochaetales bacterium]